MNTLQMRNRPSPAGWIASALLALVAYAVVSSWPELVRYRRMRAM
jgi:hypothetical protein